MGKSVVTNWPIGDTARKSSSTTNAPRPKAGCVYSLDHDLGDDERGTGYDVLLWIEEAVRLRGFVPPRMQVHSANPAARMRMLAGIAAIEQAPQD